MSEKNSILAKFIAYQQEKHLAEQQIMNQPQGCADCDMEHLKNGGEMIRRADGSYSQRGLWDNIRANKGSGKKPTKEMLEQERKIRAEYEMGGLAKFIEAGSVPVEPSSAPSPASAPAPTALSLEDQYMLTQQKYAEAQAALDAEKARIAELPAKLLANAKKKDQNNTPTRTDLAWIDEDNGRYFCSSHTCELLADSGYTVPSTYKEGDATYRAGQKFPLIPGNIQFAGLAPHLGFEPVDTPMPGDVTQELISRDEDYQGRPFKGGWMPAHSLIYSGTDKGTKMFYNAPGGARDKYDRTAIVRDPDTYKLQYYRYVGNTPKLKANAQTLAEQLAALKEQVNNQELTPVQSQVLSKYLQTAAPEAALTITATPMNIAEGYQAPEQVSPLKQMIERLTKRKASSNQQIAGTMRHGGTHGWLNNYIQ